MQFPLTSCDFPCMSNNGPSTVEVEVMVNYGARLDGSFEIVILPLTVKDSQKRRVDIVVLHPWINRLNFVQPGYKVCFHSLTAATKDAHDLKFTGEDFRDNFYRVTGDVLISDGRKARKRDSTGQPIDQVDIYGSVIMTKDGVPKEEDGRHLCWDCNKIDYKEYSLVTKSMSYLSLGAITPQMGIDGKIINTQCVFIRNTQMYASQPKANNNNVYRFQNQGPSYVALTVAVIDYGWKWLPVASWAREDTNDSAERLFTMQIELHTNQLTSLPWITAGDVLRIHRAKVMRYDSRRNITRLAHNGKEKTSVTIVPNTEHNTHKDYQPGQAYNVRNYPVGPNTGDVYELTKKLHVFAADALKKQSLKMPEEESIVIGRVSVIDKSSDRFQLSTVTDNVDDPELREVTILLRCPTSHGKTFLFHRMRPGDWVMVENMELYDAKWNSYVAQVEHVTRLPEWSYDVQHTISLMKNAEKDREAEELEELIERPTGSDEENEPPSQPSQAFGGDNYGWTQEIEKIPQGGSEIDKAIAQGGLTGPLLTQSKEGTVEVDDVFDFIEE